MQLCQEWLQIQALFPDEKFYMKNHYNKIIEKRKQNPKLLMPDDFNIYNQKEQVLMYLYAEFSKQLFNDTSYYQIVLPRDKMIIKVIEKQK